MGKVLLLTGVPAVGKTTLARKAERTISPVHTITFGEVILEVKKRTLPNATYEELRRTPTKEASIDLIERATALLLERVSQLRNSMNILIDSHAVAKDEYGFRVTPDSHDVLQKLSLDAILVLHAKHEDVAARINRQAVGRRQVTPHEVATHEALQDSVSIAYAVSTGCPVFIIMASESPEEVLGKLLRIFDLIGMDYSKVEDGHDRTR